MWAVMWLFLASPMLAATGVVLGVPIALLIREVEPEKKIAADWSE